MFDKKSCTRFERMEHTLHSFEEHQLAFSCGELTANRAAMACFLRVSADMLEGDAELDFARLFESTSLCFLDQNDQVVSILLVTHQDPHYVVEFAWTHPGYRRMGIFQTLMNTLIQCHWENHHGIRINPPIADAGFDIAVEKLGFRPVSRVTEYRPF